MSMMPVPKIVRRNQPVRVEPELPSMEDEMAHRVSQVADEVKQYAPSIHPDRISATTRIMSDAIVKVFEDTAAGIDARVAELKAKVADISAGADLFKANMKTASEALIRQIEIAMAQYEDLTHKMQESPFGPLPAVVKKVIEPVVDSDTKEQTKDAADEHPE